MSNTYKIVIPPGCGYPMFVPVDPNKLKRRWLPYGKKVEPIILCGGNSEDYFAKRYASAQPKNEDHRYDGESYPRIVSDLVPTEDA